MVVRRIEKVPVLETFSPPETAVFLPWRFILDKAHVCNLWRDHESSSWPTTKSTKIARNGTWEREGLPPTRDDPRLPNRLVLFGFSEYSVVKLLRLGWLRLCTLLSPMLAHPGGPFPGHSAPRGRGPERQSPRGFGIGGGGTRQPSRRIAHSLPRKTKAAK